MMLPDIPRGAMIRGALVVGIAALTAMLSKQEIGTREILFALLQGAIALKAFLDQSLSAPKRGQET